MLLLYYLFHFSLSEHLVEYCFGYNYGYKFFDFSGFGRNGILEGGNPASSTDRGLYFKGSNHGLIVPSFEIPTQMTTIFWILGQSSKGQIYIQTQDNSILGISENLNELSMKNSTTGQETTASCFRDGEWNLILLKKINHQFVLSSSHCDNELILDYYKESYSFLIGGC